MPRTKRADEAGKIYHALNRGNDRRELFHKPEDYLAFLRTLQQGLEKYPVDLLAYCLMPTHWHLVVRPREDGRMGKLLGWVSGAISGTEHFMVGGIATGLGAFGFCESLGFGHAGTVGVNDGESAVRLARFKFTPSIPSQLGFRVEKGL
ncbi:transposase [Neorhodopirellula pilleata]|uniref:Transposase IS200 like protein n=1 Tax=Neorhodopirellula pilleata TaxID=2714738 RepID=A0A5C5ZW42_9BACT|nr:transposase [Neorhodopirellula pilleata]TWT91325.1 Transposase IS200 like protein [Neorhodopirellula pilleata]